MLNKITIIVTSRLTSKIPIKAIHKTKYFYNILFSSPESFEIFLPINKNSLAPISSTYKMDK